jgi:geranylgeranyl diphosphate synthase, type II
MPKNVAENKFNQNCLLYLRFKNFVTIKNSQNLENYHRLFNKYIAHNAFFEAPSELYEPVNYILNLGGKRLRPLLVLMGTHLFDDHIDKALPVAFAVEIFHNFTLLHDDIMDEAPLRRGKPTVHALYGNNTGILSGDVMLIYAYHFLNKIEPNDLKSKLFTIFNKMAIEVCEGQQYDMNFERRNDVTLDEYIHMIELKTSVLIAAAFQMGALIGGASDEDSFQLYEFGRNLGIAFQIQDDILDTFGDPEKFGKKVGGDIVQNKKTYLVLRSYELATDSQCADLQQLMTSPTLNETEKIATVRNLFKELDVLNYAQTAMYEFLEKSFYALDSTPLSIERKNELKEWANDLMLRQI